MHSDQDVLWVPKGQMDNWNLVVRQSVLFGIIFFEVVWNLWYDISFDKIWRNVTGMVTNWSDDKWNVGKQIVRRPAFLHSMVSGHKMLAVPAFLIKDFFAGSSFPNLEKKILQISKNSRLNICIFIFTTFVWGALVWKVDKEYLKCEYFDLWLWMFEYFDLLLWMFEYFDLWLWKFEYWLYWSLTAAQWWEVGWMVTVAPFNWSQTLRNNWNRIQLNSDDDDKSHKRINF